MNLAHVSHDVKAEVWKIGDFCTIQGKLSLRKAISSMRNLVAHLTIKHILFSQ